MGLGSKSFAALPRLLFRRRGLRADREFRRVGIGLGRVFRRQSAECLTLSARAGAAQRSTGGAGRRAPNGRRGAMKVVRGAGANGRTGAYAARAVGICRLREGAGAPSSATLREWQLFGHSGRLVSTLSRQSTFEIAAASLAEGERGPVRLQLSSGLSGVARTGHPTRGPAHAARSKPPLRQGPQG